MDENWPHQFTFWCWQQDGKRKTEEQKIIRSAYDYQKENARISAAHASIAISPDFKYGDKIPDVYVRDEDGVVWVYTVGQHIEFSLMTKK